MRLNAGWTMAWARKLIEVALPLEAINVASAREKSIRHGHPSTLHLWWARRPLAAARAVIFAQMVDDPSAHPDLFSTEKAQGKERKRLFRIIEDLVKWESTTNEEVLERARAEIWQSWRRTCAENADDPRAKELFNRYKLPSFHDPFAGGGSIPLEAQRLGLEAYASDLNPVAVLICKAMIEIPPKFAGQPPVNPEARKDKTLFEKKWKGAQGLAEDVRYYGKWMREEAEKRIGHLYPKIDVTAEMAKARPDLQPLVSQQLTVIAWLWARTVKSPNPAFAQVDVPLASTFMLSTKAGKEAYVEPVIEGDSYRFTVKVGRPKDAEAAKNGTKLSRGANFQCVMSGTPIAGDYIKAEGQSGRMGARLMAIVAEGKRGRVYLGPTPEHEVAARQAQPWWKPEGQLVNDARAFTPTLYGLNAWSDLFTPRQQVALTTLSDLAQEARERVHRDAVTAGLPDNSKPLHDGGTEGTAYGEAVAVYLAFALSKIANIGSTIASWMSDRGAFRETFARQAIPMVWDYAEANPFADAGGSLGTALEKGAMVLEAIPANSVANATQSDAATQTITSGKLVSTDPPYYDNVPYADLSDFFYVWLRRSLRSVYPELFATLAVPKVEELVATTYRHGNKKKAEAFFLGGMTQAMHRLAEQAHPAFPVSIYYAFKQSETESDIGTASTGWEAFLDAMIRAGFATTGTWPMRTEGAGRIRAMDSNALSSSIVLVCRRRPSDAPTATRREFVAALKAELPAALANLQRGNIAPVDLAQATIGPGMAVYTRYSKVLDTKGDPLPVREALTLINQALDEALAEQEGDLDSDSRWAITWFDQHGFGEGKAGDANLLANARVTSTDGLERAGIIDVRGDRVRLLSPGQLAAGWDPAADSRLTTWEAVHHLIRALDAGGESAAAQLVGKLGSKAEAARELAYRLYTICERKRRHAEGLSYNALVQSWPEITRLAREGGKPKPLQDELFVED
jgi:putative DNA methylase